MSAPDSVCLRFTGFPFFHAASSFRIEIRRDFCVTERTSQEVFEFSILLRSPLRSFSQPALNGEGLSSGP